MKKTVLLSAISLLMAVTSCVKEEVTKENPVPGEEQTAVVVPTLSIESDNTLFSPSDSRNASIAFKSLGGNAIVYVNTNAADWEVKSEGDDIATIAADKAAGTLTISARKNSATRQLAAKYTIKAGDLTATVNVTQNAYGTPEIVASENNFHFAAVGRTSATFTVESSIDDWNFETEGIEWLLVKKNGNTITLEAYDNKDFTDREASFILYAGQGSEKVTERIAVAQDRKVNVASSALVVPMEPFPTKTADVQIASNYDWNYEIVEGTSDWFDLQRSEDSEVGGYTLGTLTFTGTDNRNADSRKAVVRITTGDGEKNVETIDIVVSQAGIDINALMMAIAVKPNSSGKVNYDMVLPFKSGNDIKIDWGDGTVEDLGTVTSAPKHTYTDQNLYVVSIWGAIPRFSFGDYYSYNYPGMVEKVYSWGKVDFEDLEGGFKSCKSLTSVPGDDFGAFANVEDMSEMFAESGLMVIPEGFLKYATKLEYTEKMFYRCGITEIPADIFYNCPELISVSDAFGANEITHVDKDIFSKNPKIEDMSQVLSQTPLEEIPAGIFDHNPEITTFNAVFANCPNLKSIPAGLFAHQTKVESFRMAFSNTAVEEIPADLFGKNYENTTFLSTFAHTNIQSIPEHLFKDFKNVETFMSCFNGCEKLETVPANLFTESGALTAGVFSKASNKSSALNMVFQGCKSLKEIPAGMFDGFPEVTGLSSVFDGCTSLTAVPAGLFKDFSKVTTFSSVFKGCTSLKSLPEGLFTGLSSATSFSGLFEGCTGLESIPANLLAGCPKVTNISKMFKSCTALKTVDENAFAGGTTVTNVSGLFDSCTSLESIPGNVFSDFSKATTTTGIFYGSGLKTVPSGLLKPFVATASFDQVFANCTELVTVEADVFPATSKAKTLTKMFGGDTALKNVGLMFGEANTAADGSIENLFSGCTALETVPAGIFDNLKAVTKVTSAFIDSGIKTLPDGLFAKMDKATTFNTCFKNCDELVEAPHNLFGSSATASSMQNMFENCDKLTTIPSDLLGTPTKGALNVSNMFLDCKALEAVPAGLFKGHQVKTYTQVFKGCTSIKTVGSEAIDCYGQNATVAGMFVDCTALESVAADFMVNAEKVTSLYNMFHGCSALKSFPVNAFDTLTLVVNAKSLFEGCTSLTGESPYTIVNGVKYHLYERTSANAEASGFKAITSHDFTFKGCTGLSDYSSIDGTWK